MLSSWSPVKGDRIHYNLKNKGSISLIEQNVRVPFLLHELESTKRAIEKQWLGFYRPRRGLQNDKMVYLTSYTGTGKLSPAFIAASSFLDFSGSSHQ